MPPHDPKTAVKGVVFDLDETLVDRRTSLDAYARQLYDDFRASTALGQADFVTRFHDLDGFGRVPRAQFFDALSAKTFAGITSAQIAEHFAANAWRTPLLFDGVVVLLQDLRRSGWRIGIVTNGGVASQSAKIDNSGLAALIDHAVISAAFGVKKPEPAIFRHALDQLGIRPAESWFIGDDPRADIQGARNVGFKTIWVERYSPWPDDLARCYDAHITQVRRARDHIR